MPQCRGRAAPTSQARGGEVVGRITRDRSAPSAWVETPEASGKGRRSAGLGGGVGALREGDLLHDCGVSALTQRPQPPLVPEASAS